MIYLKPCPFCANTMYLDDTDTIYPISSTMWSIVCSESYGGCGCTMYGDTKQSVINKWNIRFQSLSPWEIER
jgi:hypothetical protein